MSDAKVHLAYELVLTNVAAVPFRVDGVEMHDAATQALVPGTTARVDLTPLGVGAESEGTTDPGAGTTSVTVPPASASVAWVDVVFPQASAVPATIDHVVTGAVLPPAGAHAAPTNGRPPVAALGSTPRPDRHRLGAPRARSRTVSGAIVRTCLHGPPSGVVSRLLGAHRA